MLSRLRRPAWWIHSFVAICAAAVAFSLTVLLNLHGRPFLIATVAVLVLALRLGFAAGLTCAVTVLLLVDYYLVPPFGSFRLPSLLHAYELAVFGLIATIISMLADRRRRAQLTLEATLASIGDGVIVTDRDGRVTFVNSIAKELTGWTAREAKGQPVGAVFNVVHGSTRELLVNPVHRAVREGAIVALPDHAVLVCRDGTERPIADSGAPIRNEHGHTIGAVLVFRDASLQRRAEEALMRQSEERQQLLERERVAREEAEAANRLKDEFLATLSHELRTPLNAVLGWSHMLIRRRMTAEEQSQALAAIHRNAVAQARLVDDILDLSRIVTGRMALAAEAVDLSEIVRTTADAFTPALLGKRQELTLELTPDADVTGDPHRLRQIVWNLLSNATKFTPDDGRIVVRVSAADSKVQLVVSDTGQGIEAEFVPHVFDRFRQADSSPTRGHGGLGLGLSLVRYLVEAHGGTISASSEGPGHGATFTVTLPARPRTTAEPRDAHAAGSTLAGRRVLVMEDDHDPRAMTAVMLEALGARVAVHGTADEALDALGSPDGFEVIVADLSLRGADGFAFIREVRRRGISVPALAISPYTESGHRQEAHDAGFGGFLPKPMAAADLQSALLSLLQSA